MTANPSRGNRWAASVREEYDLLEDGDALVGEIARLIDRADWLEETIEALPSPVVETGSGPKTHPAVVEYRSTFATLQRALASLGLEG
ncbi:MAG: hypothetical protein ACJ72E_09620 [Marmoricola sp.]